ncbi:hypothetical protein GQ42DRAFT_172746 [Ramicandelaber brevisporus]|nr:hypothetical protein GQ42DRAFT_172746 [Ramicandelaber brevisporus]
MKVFLSALGFAGLAAASFSCDKGTQHNGYIVIHLNNLAKGEFNQCINSLTLAESMFYAGASLGECSGSFPRQALLKLCRYGANEAVKCPKNAQCVSDATKWTQGSTYAGVSRAVLGNALADKVKDGQLMNGVITAENIAADAFNF